MAKKSKIKKVVKTILLSILSLFVVCVIYYIIMFLNTNQLTRDVKNVMEGKVSYEEIEGKPIEHYYFKGGYETFDTVKYNTTRIFVWHNFSKGYIWLHDQWEVRDSNGNLVAGSGAKDWPMTYEYPTKWIIEKHNGKWEIVDIDSHP